MRIAALSLACLLLVNAAPNARSQSPAAPTKPTASAQNTILLTVFLKHDQSRTLDQLESELNKTGFYRDFPPAGTEIVSWYVVMGIGQVVTLRVPPERLRDVNRYFEQRAWGAFRTEFYPTYDFKEAFQQLKTEQQKK